MIAARSGYLRELARTKIIPSNGHFPWPLQFGEVARDDRCVTFSEIWTLMRDGRKESSVNPHEILGRSRRLSIALALISVLFPLLSSIPLRAETPEVGNAAPDFTLSTFDGKSLGLSELARSGPVVLIVLRGYPGYQCPFCTRQVHDYIAHADEFAAKRAQILLVYPGPSARLDEHAREFLTKQAKLPPNVHLVIDPDYAMTNQYGLRWDAPQETAYPSTFVMDKNRTVLFRNISRSHGDRTSAEEVLPQLPKE